MLSCREATRLASLRLDRPLSRMEQLRLLFHTAMCRRCHRHARQLRFLARATAKLRSRHDAAGIEANLSPEARERIARTLEELPHGSD